MIPKRIKVTFLPPHLCDNCFWYQRYQTVQGINKRLRLENMKLTGVKRGPGRPSRERERDDDEREDGPRDLLDELHIPGVSDV